MDGFSWRLHEALFEGGGLRAAEEAARSSGLAADVVSGAMPGMPEGGGGFCALTTIGDARRIKAAGLRGARLFFGRGYSVSEWLPELPAQTRPMGEGGVFVPWAGLSSLPPELLSFFAKGTGRVFVKPDSGNKAFPGVAADPSSFRTGLSGEVMTAPTPGTMCFVCPGRDVPEFEWRFWLSAGGGVEAVSAYSWGDGERPDPGSVPRELSEAAAYLAANWTAPPDGVFVADFCLSGGEARLVEINAASTSGLYDADPAAVMSAMERAMDLEMSDDFQGWGAQGEPRGRRPGMA